MQRQYNNISYSECIKYVRKSRTDDPSLTLEEVLRKQEFELDEFSQRVLGGIVPEPQTYREIKSSETIADRPEFCKLLKEIESKEIRAVLVREIERLSRGDLIDAGTVIKIFSLTNTLIITPTETYDLRNESDKMIVEMKLKYGNQYLEYTLKNLKRGKDLASMSGEFIGKTAPYGYEKISYKEGKKNVKTLRIITGEAEIVSLIHESYDKGMSIGSIAEMLNTMKVPTKSGKLWSRCTIAEILMNPVYMGKIRWNYRMNVKSWENQQVVVSRPRRSLEDCVLVDGLHEAIISEELFYRNHNRKSNNVPIKKSAELKNPLAGIFFCKKCGKAMKLRTGDSKNAPRFECSDMKHCGNASATYDEIIKDIYNTLAETVKDFEVKIENDNQDETVQHKKKIETMENRLQEVEKKELSLWDKYAEEGMPKEVFDKLIKKVTADKVELKKAIMDARSTMPEKIDYAEKIRTFQQAMNCLYDNSVSPQSKNTYLRAIIDKMTFEREKGVILTKTLAKEMGVPYTHPLCWHNNPYELDIILHV